MKSKHSAENSKKGSTSTGTKLGFVVGFIVSSVVNVSGIGVLLDNFIQWVGAIAVVINWYDDILIRPLSEVIADFLGFFGININPPRVLTTYYTVTAGLSLTYVFLARILERKIDTGDFFASISLFSPFSLMVQLVGDIPKIWMRIIIFPFILGVSFVLILMILTIFPYFLIRYTATSIWLHYNFDFSAAANDDSELKTIREARQLYDRTVTFWSVITVTLLMLSFTVVFNNELDKWCGKKIKAGTDVPFICRSP